MPSFDTVIEPDLVELKNAVDQANKEIGTRFDFKGSSAKVEFAEKSAKEREITLFGDSDFQLEQVRDVLLARLAKRGVDIRFLDLSAKPVKLGGDKLKQPITVRHGVPTDSAKKIVKMLKDAKIKVQAAIQGDEVRISGAKRDDLQAAIALIRKDVPDLPLTFGNFRD